MLNEFEVNVFRKNFPILDLKLPNGKDLIYFDNAATTQKPKTVIDSICDFYTTSNANTFRGMHYLGNKASMLCENTRLKIAQYINADVDEIVFNQGTTDGINLLAACLSENLKKGDEIILSEAEHHANLVPWQIVAQKTGALLKFIPITNDYFFDLEAFQSMLNEHTKIVSIQHISNVLGTMNDIKVISKLAHKYAAKVIIDGAGSLAHTKIDIKDIDCDFFVSSFHKCFGPTGMGFLFGKKDLLDKMSPYQTGGNMVNKVSFETTSFKESPTKFEPGTLNLSGIAACLSTIDFLNKINWDEVKGHKCALTNKALSILDSFNNIKTFANRTANAGIISFNIDKMHSHDVATIFDSEGIAVRSGNHCCQPLMKLLGLNSTIRISFAAYNTIAEVEKLTTAIEKCLALL